MVPTAQAKLFLQDQGSVNVRSTLVMHAVDSENRSFDLIRRDPT
jgi:hypothetical protein